MTLRLQRLPRLALIVVGLALFGCSGGPPVDAPAAAKGPVWFEEVAAERGLIFVQRSGHQSDHYMPEIMGGGAALFDMEGDGDLDVYLVQGGSVLADFATQPPNQLFRNDGTGHFEDVTEGSGAGDRGYGMGVAVGDYDDDGDPDLYVTNVGRNTLLRNEGDGHFTDQTETAGVGHDGWSASAAFLDYDRDGDLDLYSANYIHWSVETENDCHGTDGQTIYCGPTSYIAPAKDVLYRNEGDGRFADMTDALGFASGFGNGLGVVCADFDGDGWLDIFVANDGNLDQLWMSEGGQFFNDAALISGCASDQEGLEKAGMGVTTVDLDADADLDLMVGNLRSESDSIFRNEGRFFADITAQSGMGVISRMFTRFGLGWIDFDNDGDFDIYQANGRVHKDQKPYTNDPYAEPNLLFQGTDDGRFEEISPRGGTWELLIATSRGAAFGDVDGDGGIDIVVVNRDLEAYLLRNIIPDRGNWILFNVRDRSGRDAEGATVTLKVDGRLLRRDVRAGFSYQSSNSPRVHVGLGAETVVTDVTVRWADGGSQLFGDFDANQTVTLRRSKP